MIIFVDILKTTRYIKVDEIYNMPEKYILPWTIYYIYQKELYPQR